MTPERVMSLLEVVSRSYEMSEGRRADFLLNGAASIISGMTLADLRVTRSLLANFVPDQPEILTLIDGHLALREIEGRS